MINHFFSIFILKITINENYSPLWADKNLKNVIINKKCVHKKYKINGLHSDYVLNFFQIFFNSVNN